MRRNSEAQTEINEARDLLLLWYGRWQGSVPHTTPEMVLATKAFIERHGSNVPTPVFAVDPILRLE